MTLKIRLIPIALSIAMLLVTTGDVSASVTWEITDGDPYYMSDAIIVRNSSASAFTATVFNPAGLEWQDPIAGQTNWVWVRVARYGAFVGGEGQVGRLRLFVGQAGTLFAATDYNLYTTLLNPNLLEPPEIPVWTGVEWDTNLTGSKFVPIRWTTFINWFMEYNLDDTSTRTPNPGEYRWLLFEMEPHRLPSTNSSEELPFSLVAYVYDPDYDVTGDVTTNFAMA